MSTFGTSIFVSCFSRVPYLAAYEATGETPFLDAAKDAASALIHGQLESGG